MITSITPDALKERTFQSLIKDYLINDNGYIESYNNGYDQTLALDTDCLFSFLETTQEKQMNKLKEIYKLNYKNKILDNLEHELITRGSIDVIKHGIKDYGVKLDLAYFKPPTDLNPDQYLLYQQNILSVTEELTYVASKRIDLVIFLNGIPILTMELKNAFTGQSYKHAIKQYKEDRSHQEQLFRFKERSIVNFAMDTDLVFMTTRLNGDSTYFLPFNKGIGDRAGNPIVEGKLSTHYIWEEVLEKDSILEILHKFTFVDKKEESNDNGYTITVKETVIFPRYHQLDAVRKVLHHVKHKGSGNKYLIQHSAGSGKTNSITWLSHRLASLHDIHNQVIFNGVIVVTDRVILNQQLQDSIYQLEHKIGFVAKIKDGSSQLATELEQGTKIIISTIQTFPFVLKKLDGTKGKKYAIIIDEAHSSTSGKSIMALQESLSLEEAAVVAGKEEAEELDAEDKINLELEKFADRDHISFFAFTATPKGTTLRLFGTPGEDAKYKPFHLYSMRQAIEEKFIFDVLQHYMTYKMFYNVNKKVEDDPAFSKSKATKSIARYVSLHPHNISQKTEIIIEHFRNSTMNKIGGEAKAMLVTSSRLHAVRYKLAFDEYIRVKGYTDLKTLVAFSGSVKAGGDDFKETQMNGVSEAGLPKEFDKEESRVLIVANKYQTGFDQPKLHTMYVDKKLSGVKAVQTLSRLNRTCAGKEDTFVLDFVNEPDEIREAFLPFYKVTVLNNDIQPNEIYTLERTIYNRQIINRDDVMLFTELFYKDKHSKNDISSMNNCVNYSVNRMSEFNREDTIEFKGLIGKFINLYMLIIQVAPIVDSDLHRLSIYLRYLIKKIEIENTGDVNITDKVLLQFYKLQKTTEGAIQLDGENQGVDITVGGGGKVAEDPADYLSVIIDTLNKKFGTTFSESEKLAVAQIRSNLIISKDLELKAQVNSYDVFKHAFEPQFLEGVIQGYDKNQEFYGKILKDDKFRMNLMELMMLDVYSSFKGEANTRS